MSGDPTFVRKIPKVSVYERLSLVSAALTRFLQFLAAMGVKGASKTEEAAAEAAAIVPDLEDRESNEEEKPVVVDLDGHTMPHFEERDAKEETLAGVGGRKRDQKKKKRIVVPGTAAEDEAEQKKEMEPAKKKTKKKRTKGLLSFQEDDA